MRLAFSVKQLRDVHRTTEASAEIVTAVQRRTLRYIEVTFCIKVFVAKELIKRTVEIVGAGADCNQRCSAAGALILRTVV